MEQELYLTVQDAARELDVTVGAVHVALRENRLPFEVKFGRRVIARTELETYRQRTRPDGIKPTGRPKRSATT